MFYPFPAPPGEQLAIAEITINVDGQIEVIKLNEKTSNSKLNQYFIDSIIAADNLPPAPPSAGKDDVTFSVPFSFSGDVCK